MDVNDIVDIENGSKSNENEVQAPIMEDGNARSDDQVADEPSAGANTAATPLLGKKKKCMGVENRVVKQRTTTPMSKLKASKAVASSKDRAIVLVPSLAKVVQSTSASAPSGNQSANAIASAQGSIGDNEEEEMMSRLEKSSLHGFGSTSQGLLFGTGGVKGLHFFCCYLLLIVVMLWISSLDVSNWSGGLLAVWLLELYFVVCTSSLAVLFWTGHDQMTLSIVICVVSFYDVKVLNI